MNLNDKDINELLTVLNIAATQARLHDMRSTPDWPLTQEEINTARAYQDTIKKWIHLFSQQVGGYTEESED